MNAVILIVVIMTQSQSGITSETVTKDFTSMERCEEVLDTYQSLARSAAAALEFSRRVSVKGKCI